MVFTIPFPSRSLGALQNEMHAMAESALEGCRVLVVEDEYFLASDLAHALADRGAIVIGPVGRIADAVAIIAAEPVIHGAILDLNLHGEMIFPVADLLMVREVAFIFMTGYDLSVFPTRFKHIVKCEKPFTMDQALHAMAQAIHG